MTHRINIAVVTLVAASLLGGCTTIKKTNLDFLKIPEFKEAAQKLIEGYPNVVDAPTRPDDIRTAKEWDAAAKALIARRESFAPPSSGPMATTDAELLARIEALRAEVRSYKLDDPQ